MATAEQEEEEEDPPTIVIDSGTINTYFGFAGDDAPRTFVSSVVDMNQNDEEKKRSNDIDINHIYESQLDLNWSSNLCRYNEIRSIDDMESIIKEGEKRLIGRQSVDYAKQEVLLSQSDIFIARETRMRLTQIMFESIGCRGYYEGNSIVLALYAAGRCTGLVLDSGHHKTTAVAIYEGYALPHSVQSLGLGGLHISHYLKSLVDNYNVDVSLMDCHRIKQQHAYVRNAGSNMTVQPSYTLPDGKTMLNEELFLCTQILFNPHLIDYTQNDEIYAAKKRTCSSIVHYYLRHHVKYQDTPSVNPLFTVAKIRNDRRYTQMSGLLDGLNQSGCFNVVNDYYNGPLAANKCGIVPLVKQTIDLSDFDIHSDLAGNVVLTNGNTLFDGLSQRVQTELGAVLPSSINVKVCCPEERRVAAWIGGSILASIGRCWEDPFISPEEYAESGPSIVLRKCT